MKVISRIATASAALATLLLPLSRSYAQPRSNVSSDATIAHKTPMGKNANVSDAALVKSVPGFRNGYAEVDGVRLHYVVGGSGHFIQEEQPDLVVKTIIDFLQDDHQQTLKL